MDEYAHAAALYDPIVGPFLRPIHQAMVDVLLENGCRTVADLCCGTGLFVGLASKKGVKVTGVDISQPMLDVAKKKTVAGQLIHTDATQLSFSDGAFDASSISFALHEKPLETAIAIFEEAVRIVRPGGIVLIADYRLPKKCRSFFTKWGIRTVERLAGKEHHAHFTQFMKLGGSEAFLAEGGFSVRPHRTFMSGWAGVFVLRRP